ncbi:MAG: protein kinase [Candidatus Eisenbacteria bacterium]|uniref:Protein kinase n=1 Tax=Eiseniibacteriota bacterium TaxID=2212470 RepID=A0A933W2Z9_UNCEI|nr:protein kinase [Candidatus Eisenbacteria bacterium]
MSLTPGSRLGMYEVIAPLGAGGMGEVYRARDTRLGRDVAIKSLPDGFDTDAERVARFEREAKLLASLHHTNIGSIFGLEVVEGRRYLVLEFIEGETLQARLARGRLTLAETLDVCGQIATAVEAAHEAGVIHRDLKPGNVMLKADGDVKVLDFGLAKASGGDGSPSSTDLSASPTMTYAATGVGVILGTAAYMSPEQARGKQVDRRTDIWSFGCVLFECLSGKRMIEGETVSDMVARILEREPDWSALPAATPPRLVALLKRCLTKDAKLRQRDMGDVRLELTAIAGGETGAAAPVATTSAPRRTPAWTVAVGAIALVALGVAAARLLPGGRASSRAMSLKLMAPAGVSFGLSPTDLVLSPDGKRIVFVGSDTLSGARLWVRELDREGVRPLDQTANAAYPFWSPDGKRLGFFADDKLKIVSLATGAVTVIADAPLPRGGAWGRDAILFQPRSLGPLYRVSPDGGTPVVATAVDSAGGDVGHRFPQFLPDGRPYVAAVLGAGENWAAVGTLGQPKLTKLFETYAATGVTFAAPGWLVAARDGAVKAQRFDPRTRKLTGPALTVPGLRAVSPSANGSPIVSASNDGLLMQRAAGDLPQRLAVVDASGREVGQIAAPEGTLTRGGITADGRRVAFEYATPQAGHVQIWAGEIDRGSLQPFTFEQDNYTPAFSPDGRQIALAREVRGGSQDVWLMDGVSPGEPRFVLRSPTRFTSVLGWAPDGKGLLVRSQGTDTRQDLLFVDLRGDSATVRTVAGTRFNEPVGSISPDGRWLAYVSDESGAPECRVRAFGGAGGGTVVSRGAWCDPAASSRIGVPVWRRDGRQLLYCGSDAHTLMVVDVTPGEVPQFGPPRPLFRLTNAVADLLVSPGLDRFVLSITREEEGRSAATLLADWPSMLEDAK